MKKFFICLYVFIFSFSLIFASSNISLSLWENIAYPNDTEIAGLELGIGSFLQELKGVQFNFLLSRTQKGVGVKMAPINDSNDFKGLNFGALNISDNFFKGFQLGFVNISKNMTGFQLGIFNYTENADSFLLQLGLVNYLKNSIIYQWFPFINFLF